MTAWVQQYQSLVPYSNNENLFREIAACYLLFFIINLYLMIDDSALPTSLHKSNDARSSAVLSDKSNISTTRRTYTGRTMIRIAATNRPAVQDFRHCSVWPYETSYIRSERIGIPPTESTLLSSQYCSSEDSLRANRHSTVEAGPLSWRIKREYHTSIILPA
jgi:hypothetical protein